MSAKAQSIKLKETENQEARVAQWQTCVEKANAVSAHRDTMNNLFVTLNETLNIAFAGWFGFSSNCLTTASFVSSIAHLLYKAILNFTLVQIK